MNPSTPRRPSARATQPVLSTLALCLGLMAAVVGGHAQAAGSVYVSSEKDNKIVVFDTDGNLLPVLLCSPELRRLRGATVADEMTGSLIVYDNTTDVFTVDGSVTAAGQPAATVREAIQAAGLKRQALHAVDVATDGEAHLTQPPQRIATERRAVAAGRHVHQLPAPVQEVRRERRVVGSDRRKRRQRAHRIEQFAVLGAAGRAPLPEQADRHRQRQGEQRDDQQQLQTRATHTRGAKLQQGQFRIHADGLVRASGRESRRRCRRLRTIQVQTTVAASANHCSA